MNNEKFIFLDMKSIKTKNGEPLFYIIIYSTLTEQSQKVFVSMEDYEYLLKNKNNIDINKNLTRYYNSSKNKFGIKFSRI